MYKYMGVDICKLLYLYGRSCMSIYRNICASKYVIMCRYISVKVGKRI